ncbi:MAG: outer membrane protein assembly factor BamE [Gallionella sp.]
MRIKIILLTLLLASCDSFYVPLITPYKMDIRQGNFVTPDMRAKLQLGMTKAQVRYVLGTPLLNDIFHANRWDYAYRFEHKGKVVDAQNLTIYFDGDKLVRIDDGSQPAVTVPEKAPADEKG